MKNFDQSPEETKVPLFDSINAFAKSDIDWVSTDHARSIGEILLQISAFQFLLTSAVVKKNGRQVDIGLWKELKPGFAIETGFAKLRNRDIPYYHNISDQVIGLTNNTIYSFPASTKVSDKDLEALVRLLEANDIESHNKYQKLLMAGYHSKLFHGGNGVSYPRVLNSHELYQRGQIFFHKFLMENR